MNLVIDEPLQRHVRVGATGGVGAVTLLWLGWLNPHFFPAGTVLLTVSLVPLAAGLRARGGALLGLLFGILWIAARLGLTDEVDQNLLLNQPNVIALFGMVAIGLTAGVFFNVPEAAKQSMPPSGFAATGTPHAQMNLVPDVEAREEQELLREILQRHKEWMADWNRKETPWIAFDTHVRELLLKLTGANRIRCYHFGLDDKLSPLNAKDSGEFTIRPMEGVLAHVLATGQRFAAASIANGPMLKQLAAESVAPVAWAIPIRQQEKTIGLITVEAFGQDEVNLKRLDLAADFIEQFWRHVQEADELRFARLTDSASGVLNRGEFLSVVNETVECSYALYEPVVVFALSVEGIRRLDDAGEWAQRNEVIELVGHTIRDRLRHDDIVGRFSDELFVAILRRLDVPLAELIARKLIDAVEASLDKLPLAFPLALRGGLAGSGWNHDPGEKLLQASLSALKAARAQGVRMGVSSTDSAPQEQRT